MTSAKQLFLRKEPGKQSLAEWWVTVTHDERFDLVMVYAKAHAFEIRLTPDQFKGAELILEALQTLSDNEETTSEFPSPHLIHEMPVKGQPKPSEKKA